MGVTRLRGDQIRGASITGSEIRDHTITEDDLIPGVTGNATKIRGRTVADAIPLDGQALVWSSSLSEWIPAFIGATTIVTALDGTAVTTMLGEVVYSL
jgi:hypothetical protein